MTCFWQAIASTLTSKEKRMLGIRSGRPKEIVFQLKKVNEKIKVEHVLWNGSELSAQELREHSTAIREYDATGIYNGHLCGTCDSFLVLLCFALNWHVRHNYRGHTITYQRKRTAVPPRQVRFASNSGHFYCG